jgi:hypothetical protein
MKRGLSLVLIPVLLFVFMACVDFGTSPPPVNGEAPPAEQPAAVGCGPCQYENFGICVSYNCCSDEDCKGAGERCVSSGTVNSYCKGSTTITPGDGNGGDGDDGGDDDEELCGPCQYFEGGECRDYECCYSVQCDDGDPSTVDTCENHECKNEKKTCGECQYLDESTWECEDYACCSDGDCDDDVDYTDDVCEYPGTLDAFCRNSDVCDYECCGDEHCDDNDEGTDDVCVNPGKDSAWCAYLEGGYLLAYLNQEFTLNEENVDKASLDDDNLRIVLKEATSGEATFRVTLNKETTGAFTVDEGESKAIGYYNVHVTDSTNEDTTFKVERYSSIRFIFNYRGSGETGWAGGFSLSEGESQDVTLDDDTYNVELAEAGYSMQNRAYVAHLDLLCPSLSTASASIEFGDRRVVCSDLELDFSFMEAAH